MLRSLLPVLATLASGLCAQSPLETTFVGATSISNTSPPAAATILLDIVVTAPQGIVISQIDVNINTASGTTGTLGVWMTANGVSHVGSYQTPALWTQMASATRSFTGGRTSFVLQPPFYVAPGSYGLALHHIGMNPVYTPVQTPPLPGTYVANELVLDVSQARVRSSAPTAPFSAAGGPGFTPRTPNMAVHFTVGPTYVQFTGTPTTGASPLNVQFTSYAASGNPGGILGYAWDFDNDGTFDSSLPNPQWTYTNCGAYTVALTVFDALGGTTRTRTNYVVTDVVTPRFTNELIGPQTVRFTDASTPTPTSWSWDLNGDGTPDSSVQNPVWTYPSGCTEITVSLTAGLACQPPTTLTKKIAVASSLETTFQGGLVTGTAATSAANYFDVAVANPLGVTVCAMHVRSDIPAGGPLVVDIYQAEGSYVGKTGDANQWRRIGSATVSSAGIGQRTFVPFAQPFHLAAGDYGICMVHTGASPVYTPFAVAQTYGNADLAITAGLAQAAPVFGATAATYSPRIANVALHYRTSQAVGAPGYGFIGAGCTGTLGIPTNVSTTQPVVGGAATIVVGRLPLDIAVLIFGTFRLDPPIDLGIVGMPGCRAFAPLEATGTLLGAGNAATFPFAIPNNPTLVGTQIYSQAASLDPGVNALGFSISDAAVLLVGQ